jgi:hypothetical protein
MNDSKRDEQRAAYGTLLLSLARQAAPDRLYGLCDRVERTLAARTAGSMHHRRRGRRAGAPKRTLPSRQLRRRDERQGVEW